MRTTTVLFVALGVFSNALGCGADDPGSDNHGEAGASGVANANGAAGTDDGASGNPIGGGNSGSAGAGGASGGASGSSAKGGASGAGTGGMAGANAGRGGNAGTGGGPPLTVHACNDLPAVGKWEPITPPQIVLDGNSAGMVSVAVDPTQPGVVFTSGGHQSCCGSGSQGIFKSTDCGATWTKVNTGRNAQQIDSGWHWAFMLIDSSNSQNMYVSNGYGSPAPIFKTSNGGIDWDPAWGTEVSKYLASNFASEIAMDPGDPKHLVVSFHENCVGEFAPMCMAETTDGAATWRVFKGPTNGWEEGAGPIVLDAKTILYAAPFNGLYYTGDGAKTWEKVAPDGFSQIYHATDGSMYIGSAQHGVIRSTDGHAWTPIPNTAPCTGIVGDGQNIFASFQQDTSGQPYWSAPENDWAHWTHLVTPQIKSGGSILAYDNQHHILYSANYSGGVWRSVTR